MQQSPDVGAAQAALRAALENAYAEKGSLLPFVGISFAPTTQRTADILTSVLASNQYKYSLFTGQANRLSDTVALFQALGGGW